jgi:RNA polymerase sigma factor (sigma-70 family)
MSGVAEAPSIVADDGDDARLVAAVRHGDDRAFETLYTRYHRRIQAYVLGMVKDHGRAEDVTQEVFVSALRRMRATERPILFKPWIYEIAKNACIDQYRRTRRTEEVSLEADDGLAPADYGKLVNSAPAPEVAVAAKQDLDSLCGALGGLSDTHHEILMLREFEGLSYQEIGERMNLSRPAVESTLFRARRRLTEEFDELVSGARCQRIQVLIATASETRLGTRESRRLSRHISHCQPCRREAMAAGLDSEILTHVPLRRRAAEKLAGLLPFPIFGRSRGGNRGDGAGASTASSGGGWMSHLPMFSEQFASGWGKVATGVAVLVAGAGAAGVGSQVVAAGPDTGLRDRPALERRAADRGASAASAAAQPAAEGTRTAARAGGAAADRKASAKGGAGSQGGGDAKNAPGKQGNPATDAVDRAGRTVGETVNGAGNAVGETVKGTGKTVGETVKGTGKTVGETVEAAGDRVGDTVKGAGDTVGEAVKGAGNTVGGTVDDVGNTVGGAVDGVGGVTGGSGGGALPKVDAPEPSVKAPSPPKVDGGAATSGVTDAVGGATGAVEGATGVKVP